MGASLLLLLDQNLTEEEKACQKLDLERKRRWNAMELVISGLVRKRRQALAEGVQQMVSWMPKVNTQTIMIIHISWNNGSS